MHARNVIKSVPVDLESRLRSEAPCMQHVEATETSLFVFAVHACNVLHQRAANLAQLNISSRCIMVEERDLKLLLPISSIGILFQDALNMSH